MAKFARAVITTVFTVIGSAIGGPIGAAIGTFVGTMLGKIILPPSKGKPRAAAATSLQIGEVPRQAIVGRAATAGSLVDAFNYGGKYGTDWEVLVIALADHRCDALEGFYVNDSYVPFAGDGAVAGYNNQLSIYWRPGTETQSVPSVLTANGPGWTVNDNGAGVSYAVVAYKADAADAKNPVWPNGRPRFLFVVRGALCYDPRLDSTVGGAGAHRWADPATWTWSENPIVTRYKFARGFFACDRVNQPDQLLVGRGLSTVEAPPANLFHRANLCDEIVDGEPRYRVGGLIEATETYIDVESDFAAACAGTIIQPEGSVEIDPGEAKAPVVTITDADLVVGSKVKRRWFLGIADRAWVNSVVASYIEPSQKWSALAAPVRRSIADIQADGAPREEALSLGFVQWQKQAGRVAEIVRRMGRLFLRAELVLPPRYCDLEEGDWIIWQSDRYLNGQAYTFRIEAWGSDKAWQHSVVLRQISASCYTDTAPLTDGSVAVQQAARPAIGAPAAGNWSVSAGHLAAGGIRTPALIVSGASDDPSARFVRLEYVQSVAAPTASTIWSDAGVTGPDVKRREIAVAAGGSYWVAISYVVDGIQGDRLVLGSVTALTVAYPDGTAVESLKPGEPGATNDANLDDPTQLTINEKTRLIPTEAVRGGRKAQLRSRMVALGISVTALDAAEANWLTYRDSVYPAWNASSQHSTINRATWNSLSVLYDAALDAGDKAVSEEDAKRANWANVAQTPNAPADNATVGAIANVNLRKEDNTLVADPDFLNNRLEANVLRISAPVGGALNTNGIQTGAIKIALPTAGQYTMVRFYVDVYEYDINASQTYEVGGYTWGDGFVWLNCFANALGRSPSVRAVRFGFEGGAFCVFIGELAGSWSYPSVRIRDVQASYANFAESIWKTGWALSWKTSAFPTIHATISKPVAGDALAGVNTRRESGVVVGDALLMNDNQRFDQVVLGFGRPENNADVTLTAQVTTIAPDDVTINADYLGAIIAGQFNKVVTPSVTRGGVSVRTDNRATYSATNITGGLVGFVTMNNTNGSADKGRATITNCTSTGSYQHNIFWDGVLIASYVVRFLVQAASPPSGGGGSGSYSGNFDVTGFTIFGTGFVEVNRISNLSNLNGNILRCILPFATYQATSNTNTVSRSAVVKAQYSPVGANSWTDVAAAVTGSFSTWVMQDFSGDEGTVSFSHSTAISVGAAYFDVRLVAAMNVSGANSSIYFTGGTFSAEIGT